MTVTTVSDDGVRMLTTATQLARARASVGYSQRDVGDFVGRNQVWLSRVERGVVQPSTGEREALTLIYRALTVLDLEAAARER